MPETSIVAHRCLVKPAIGLEIPVGFVHVLNRFIHRLPKAGVEP
jgi:hypothetical protein